MTAHLTKALLGMLEGAHLHAEVVLRKGSLGVSCAWEGHSRLGHEACHAWETACLLAGRWEPSHA